MSVHTWTGATNGTFSTASNYSEAAAPNGSDSIYIGAASTRAITGGDYTGLGTNSVYITMNNIYAVGDNGTPLKMDMTVCDIGIPSSSATAGNGAGRINLDLDDTASTIYVRNSAGSSTDAGKEPIRIKGVNAATVVHVTGGRVGFATDTVSDVATFGTINVTGTGAVVNMGTVTLTTLNMSAGTVTAKNTITLVSQDGGTFNTEGTYNLPTVYCGAAANLKHRNTQTTVTITRSSQVATVAWTSHGRSVGDLIMIHGANEYQYTGCKVIETVPNADSFTFTVNGTPTTPATGTIRASQPAVTSLYLYEGAVVDLSGDATAFAVGTIYLNGDATIKVNAANPNHFDYGYLVRERGTLTITG